MSFHWYAPILATRLSSSAGLPEPDNKRRKRCPARGQACCHSISLEFLSAFACSDRAFPHASRETVVWEIHVLKTLRDCQFPICGNGKKLTDPNPLCECCMGACATLDIAIAIHIQWHVCTLRSQPRVQQLNSPSQLTGSALFIDTVSLTTSGQRVSRSGQSRWLT